MVIVLKDGLDNSSYLNFLDILEQRNLSYQVIEKKRVIHVILPREEEGLVSAFKSFPQVESVLRTAHDVHLARQQKLPLKAAGLTWGGRKVQIIAGPCAVENEKGYLDLAFRLKELGVNVLRGAIFKPRTSPYSFQGMGEEGLSILKRARQEVNLPVITEILDPRDLDKLYDVVDIFQVGSRNMKNYSLLKELGRQDKPVLLKRGMSSTYREFLLAAEYLLMEGNSGILLCERGIRTFETYTRNTLDLAAVPALHELSGLPVIVDPSHGTGAWELVPSMCLAALAAGADGLMIEVHPRPEEALSDGCQSLTLERFSNLLFRLSRVACAVERQISVESEDIDDG